MEDRLSALYAALSIADGLSRDNFVDHEYEGGFVMETVAMRLQDEVIALLG